MTATEKEETTRATEKKETGAGRRSGYRYLRFLIAFGWWGIVALLITEFVLHPPWGDRSVFGQDVPGEFVLGWCIAGGVLPLLRGNRFRFSGLETYAKRFSGKSWGPDMAVMGGVLLWMFAVLWVLLRYSSWLRARVKLEWWIGVPFVLFTTGIWLYVLSVWIVGKPLSINRTVPAAANRERCGLRFSYGRNDTRRSGNDRSRPFELLG